LTKYIFGDKVALTSSTIFLTNKIMGLAYYNFGVYSFTYVMTNHGELTETLLMIFKGVESVSKPQETRRIGGFPMVQSIVVSCGVA
jgi:hypothetical protein